MRRSVLLAGGLGCGLLAGAMWWRRNPRVGTRFANEVVDPWLVRHGLVDQSKGELAILEHVGRTSGKVRLTLVHPERLPDGIRILVPLGDRSEWARNVLAAGHCRMQIADVVIELDEPMMVEPSEVGELLAPMRALYQWLGFRYLLLHRFAESAGTLTGLPNEAAGAADAEATGDEEVRTTS